MRIRCKIGIIACLNQLVISIRLQSYANYFNLQSRVDNYFSFIASFFAFRNSWKLNCTPYYIYRACHKHETGHVVARFPTRSTNLVLWLVLFLVLAVDSLACQNMQSVMMLVKNMQSNEKIPKKRQ